MHGELYKKIPGFWGRFHYEPIHKEYCLAFELVEVDHNVAKYTYSHISWQGYK